MQQAAIKISDMALERINDAIISGFKEQRAGIGPFKGFVDLNPAPVDVVAKLISDKIKTAKDPSLEGLSIASYDFVRTLDQNQKLLEKLNFAVKENSKNIYDPSVQKGLLTLADDISVNYLRCYNNPVKPNEIQVGNIQHVLDKQILLSNEIIGIVHVRNPKLAEQMEAKLNTEKNAQLLTEKVQNINIYEQKPTVEATQSMGFRMR